MRSGTLRNYIEIQVNTPIKSDSGAQTKVWTEFIKVWASIRTMSGNEKQSADAAWPGSDSMIKFHYIDGVLPTMRIVYKNVIYSILNINNVDFRDRELRLTCQSGAKPS